MHAICLEASHNMGMGHLFRMVALARAMRASHIPITIFINQNQAAQSILASENLPHETIADKDDSNDWETPLIHKYGIRVWINDRLTTTAAHATRVKRTGAALVTFDDDGPGASLADLHFADLPFFWDQNLGGSRVLRGLDYLILDSRIEALKRKRDSINKTIITLGGADTHGATIKVISLIKELDWTATVVAGPAFEHWDELVSTADSRHTIKRNVPSMIEELSMHDLAVTGGGITAYEACALGLPAIVIANEGFEAPTGRLIESLGCGRFAGHHASMDKEAFRAPFDVHNMSTAGLEKVHTSGCANVMKELLCL